jgi:hypothetical protein
LPFQLSEEKGNISKSFTKNIDTFTGKILYCTFSEALQVQRRDYHIEETKREIEISIIVVQRSTLRRCHNKISEPCVEQTLGLAYGEENTKRGSLSLGNENNPITCRRQAQRCPWPESGNDPCFESTKSIEEIQTYFRQTPTRALIPICTGRHLGIQVVNFRGTGPFKHGTSPLLDSLIRKTRPPRFKKQEKKETPIQPIGYLVGLFPRIVSSCSKYGCFLRSPLLLLARYLRAEVMQRSYSQVITPPSEVLPTI